MPNPVISWQIDAPEPAKLVDFYAGVFDWEPGSPGHFQDIHTNAGEGIDGGVHLSHPDDESVRLMLVIRVDEITGILDRVKAMGGTVEGAPRQLPDGRTVATFRDPSGNFIQIMRQPETASTK